MICLLLSRCNCRFENFGIRGYVHIYCITDVVGVVPNGPHTENDSRRVCFASVAWPMSRLFKICWNGMQDACSHHTQLCCCCEKLLSNLTTIGGGKTQNTNVKTLKEHKKGVDKCTCMEIIMIQEALELEYKNRRTFLACLDESNNALSLYGRPSNFF